MSDSHAGKEMALWRGDGSDRVLNLRPRTKTSVTRFSDISSASRGAVFVSYGPNDPVNIFEVADKITRRGATVFLDEVLMDEAGLQRESRILDAVSFADELLIVITAFRKDSFDKNSEPAFLDRRFIWLAIGVAFARGIPIRGLLRGPTRKEVKEDPAIPAFIKGIALFETLEEYLEQLEAGLKAQARKAQPNNTRRPQSNCRVCLFCGRRTVSAVATIEKQLRGAGIETNRWHRGASADNFDAMAIIFHEVAGRIWQPGLVRFVQACIGQEKPVVLLTLASNRKSPKVPNWFKPKLSYVEYRKSDSLSLRRLLWAMVGYREYDLGAFKPSIVAPVASSKGPERLGGRGTARDRIFVSYAHKDKRYYTEFYTMLKPITQELGLEIWSDRDIRRGDKWREKIEDALARTKIGVLLLSPDYLASEFVVNHELPVLLAAAETEGVRICWIACRPSHVPKEINVFQGMVPPKEPLAKLSRVKREQEWQRITQELLEISRLAA